MNSDLENLNDWFKANKLSLNVSKSCYLLFSNSNKCVNNVLKIGNEPLQKESVTKFLGVNIDEKLSWVDYINYGKRKLFSGMFAINKVKAYTDYSTSNFVFYTGVPIHYIWYYFMCNEIIYSEPLVSRM